MSCFFSCVNVFVYESNRVYKYFISVLCMCYYWFFFFNVYNKHNMGFVPETKYLVSCSVHLVSCIYIYISYTCMYVVLHTYLCPIVNS